MAPSYGLSGYASTMESVQSLEWALKRLAVDRGEIPDGIGFDEAWRRTEKLLRKPIGGLQEAAPPGLAQRLPELKRIRNHLAHDVLLRWRLETNIGLATHQEVIEGLIEVEAEFRQLAEQLDAVADQNLREKGIDLADIDLSADELREILRRDEGR